VFVSFIRYIRVEDSLLSRSSLSYRSLTKEGSKFKDNSLTIKEKELNKLIDNKEDINKDNNIVSSSRTSRRSS
jgi:hypothetical protein